MSAVQIQNGTTIRLPSNESIGSITIDASSFVGNLTIYNGTQATNQLFEVGSGQVKTIPVGSSRNLFIKSTVLGSGNIYLQFTDQYLSSTTNLSQIAPVASQTWTLLSEGVVGQGGLHGTISDPVYGTLAYIQLVMANQSVQNGKGTFPNIYLQTLDVSGLPKYVTSGVFVSAAGVNVPSGIASLLTGPGRWAPASGKLYGVQPSISPQVYAMFGNYDGTGQIFGGSMQFSLSGYST